MEAVVLIAIRICLAISALVGFYVFVRVLGLIAAWVYLLLTGDRVMSKKVMTAADISLACSITTLKAQISCAAGGHSTSVHSSATVMFGKRVVRFFCSNCNLDFQKEVKDLTKKEKALLDAFDMKE